MEIDVVLSPAEIARLPDRDLGRTTCIVFDVLRATSTMLAALEAGASGILPVGEIGEAIAARERHPGALLAGERDGRRITAEQSRGVEFDLGNSPREMTADRVGGRLLISTTTNGTRAIRACASAHRVLIASLANLQATASILQGTLPDFVCLVCSGTGEAPCLEDTLAAGALIDGLRRLSTELTLSDMALVVEGAYLNAQPDFVCACLRAKNARRLLAIPELAENVAWCLVPDRYRFAAQRGEGEIIRACD